ncbi:hypothetical protein HPB47_016431 [Ixodes persulcatus]|uniref:Uncharacterized protein n=1 Tax=Ixodes persulcatus TaxID=34615 RepID=A0AC60QTC8_IXOPE|nr:hypothetical protein HPB47_016431 [Ixodes persulcatus]
MSARDPRIAGWGLSADLSFVLPVSLGYLYVVKVAGPRWMRNRPPYDLKTVITLYNLCQVIANVFFCVQFFRHSYLGGGFSVLCQGTYSDAVCRGPAPRTESMATKFSLEDLAGPFLAPKQPAGKQGAPGNAGSTQTPQSIQARPPADRQPRASGSSRDGERGRHSNSSDAARLVTEQQGPPAAPSTSKDVGSVNAGGSRPGTSKPSSAGSVRGRKPVAQVSDHVGTGKPASKVQDAAGAADIADSSGPSSDQEDMEWQPAKSKQKGKKPVVPP